MEMKHVVTTAGAVLWGFFGPLMPMAGLCTVMVLLDFVSAVRLGLRLRRKGIAPQGGKLSSHRFGTVVATLAKIFAALAVAAMAQKVLFEGYMAGFDAVRAVGGAVCFWQLMSVLENESTCSDSRWAEVARRNLADKAGRHM